MCSCTDSDDPPIAAFESEPPLDRRGGHHTRRQGVEQVASPSTIPGRDLQALSLQIQAVHCWRFATLSCRNSVWAKSHFPFSFVIVKVSGCELVGLFGSGVPGAGGWKLSRPALTVAVLPLSLVLRISTPGRLCASTSWTRLSD